MTHKSWISIWAASPLVGGYPKLLLNLAREHGLEVYALGRARYVKRDNLEQLAQLVGDWLGRPRMSVRSQTGTRADEAGRPGNRTNGVHKRARREKPLT